MKSENTWIFFFRYCFVSFNLTIMNQCHISGVVVAVCLCMLLQTASASLYYTGYSPALYGWNQPSTDFFGNFSGGSLVMPIFRKSSISFAQINTMIVWFLFLASLMPFLCNCHGVRSVTFPNCFYSGVDSTVCGQKCLGEQTAGIILLVVRKLETYKIHVYSQS